MSENPLDMNGGWGVESFGRDSDESMPRIQRYPTQRIGKENWFVDVFVPASILAVLAFTMLWWAVKVATIYVASESAIVSVPPELLGN